MAVESFGWGVWGTGAIAAQFAEDLAHVPGAIRAAVCSRSAGNAEVFARTHGFAKHHADPGTFLDDPDVNAVYIASPNPLHREQALAAIAAGKPVLIEKPLAMTSADIEAIQEAAAQASVFAMEALWTRFLPAVQRARELLTEGTIGKIERAEASLVFHRPFDASNRLFDPALGGGVLLDLGVYPISVAGFLFGTPELVQARWRAAPTGVDVDAELTIRCEHVPVAIRTGFVERSDQEGDNHFFIHGTEGALRVDRHFLGASSLTLWDRPVAHAPASRGWSERLARRLPVPGRTQLSFTRHSRGLNYQAAAVQAAVQRGETSHPSMPLGDSAAVLKVIEQALAGPPTESSSL